MPNEEQTTNPDVKLAFETIKQKNPLYNELYKYYTGHHPLKYSTAKLHEVFKTLNVYFAENWLGVIVDAVIDRLILKGFDISGNAQAKSKLDDIWKDQNIQLIAEDVHESVTITNEAFVIAMKVDDGEGGEELEIYFNDARMCHVFYDPKQPNKKRMGAKIWTDEKNYFHLALYYPDRFEYYRSQATLKTNSAWPSSWKNLIVDPDNEQEDNPFENIVPVFHWQASTTTKKRDMGPSEVSLQDAINKLLADMMVSSDFNTYLQRVVISQADPGNLQNSPNFNWWVPQPSEGPASQVLELGGKALTPFLEGMDKLATALAIISRTPKHYFFAQGGDPSGEALIALEAPLNKKVKKRQARLSVEWQNFAQFLLMLEKIKVERKQVTPTWEPAETMQPKTQAEITKLDKEAGIPVVTSKRRQGWSPDEISQLEDDIAKENKTKTGLAQDALDKLRAEDAQNNAVPGANNNGQVNTQAQPGNQS